ncbi:hypothetical protein AMATHDRAFT_75185 [Amanita thiersii Skay4041]|uniref:Uncharacterized protein n=1 Tax=Amanita thiersii Skay4041 TaxID=703135 RepID=A0A2A9NS55_9AGAR|nr:hypothetical protein AMATHDRAFT_75185 [Amanita thiersii Skay4041]
MSYILNKAGRELFQRHIEQYAPPDPLYEYTTDTNGKKKRSKRALPPGLSKRDAKILQSIQRRAHYLDKGFSLCGLRFGWLFLIALIPIVGDLAGALLNHLLVIRKARKAELPRWLVTRMMFNNAVSVGVGMVPFAGDLVLAVWKTNSRNAILLEEFLRVRGEEWLRVERERPAGAPTTTSTTREIPGLTESDRHQVKPGAGMEPGENVIATDDVNAGKKKNFTGIFDSLRRKNHGKAPPAGEKGRFIEHVPANEPFVAGQSKDEHDLTTGITTSQ